MLAIAAAGAFVALFALWVILPRKFLRDKPNRQRRGGRYNRGQGQEPPADSTPTPTGSP